MTLTRTATILALIGSLTTAAATQSPDADLRRAIQKEATTGDLAGAIADYKRVVASAGSNRTVAAQALMRMAECYQKLGDREARTVYETLIRDYGDQRDAAAEARRRLGAMPLPAASGRTTRQLWVGANVDGMGTPSADGRYLSFTDWETGDLGIRDVPAGTNRRLTNTGGWDASGDMGIFSAVSPDGNQVAVGWFTNAEKRYDLRLVPTAESGKPRIVYRPAEGAWIRPYAWTPDGTRILAAVGRTAAARSDIGFVTINDGSFRVIKTVAAGEPRGMSLSPDGRFVAYEAFSRNDQPTTDIFVMAIDGTRDRTAVDHPANDQHPLWSPDGAHLVFLSDRTGRSSLWTIPIKDGVTTGAPDLIADVGPISPLGITRTGGLMYFLGGGRRNPYVAEIDADLMVAKPPVIVSERFLNANTSPAWSPNGQWLAYYSFRGAPEIPGSTALVIRNVATGRERDVFLNVPIVQQNAVGLSWFPDGRTVLVVARNTREGTTDYHRVDVDSGAVTRVRSVSRPAGVSTNTAVIAPDGKTIFHIERDEPAQGGQVTRVDLESGKVAHLTQARADTGATSLAISPDGATLAYLHFELATRSTAIVLIPAAGGQPRELFRAQTWNGGDRFNTLSWSRDGRFLLFVRTEGQTQHAWRLPAAGGTPQKIGLSFPGMIKGLNVHPDGRRLVYTGIETDGNSAIWMLDNFLPRPVVTPVRRR